MMVIFKRIDMVKYSIYTVKSTRPPVGTGLIILNQNDGEYEIAFPEYAIAFEGEESDENAIAWYANYHGTPIKCQNVGEKWNRCILVPENEEFEDEYEGRFGPERGMVYVANIGWVFVGIVPSSENTGIYIGQDKALYKGFYTFSEEKGLVYSKALYKGLPDKWENGKHLFFVKGKWVACQKISHNSKLIGWVVE